MNNSKIKGGIETGNQNIKVFNEQGREEYHARLKLIWGETENPIIDNSLLFDNSLTKELQSSAILDSINIDQFIKQNSNKPVRVYNPSLDINIPEITHWDLVKYIFSVVDLNEVPINDRLGLYDWLSAYFLPLYLSNRGKNLARYSTMGITQSYSHVLYRNMVYGTIYLYDKFGEIAKIQLSHKSNIWGDRLEQTNARPHILHQVTFIVINRIFNDLISKEQDPLTIDSSFEGLTQVYKELVKILDGFSKNYFIEKMDSDDLFELLPDLLKNNTIKGLKEFQKINLSRP